jgi:hypothetical protein
VCISSAIFGYFARYVGALSEAAVPLSQGRWPLLRRAPRGHSEVAGTGKAIEVIDQPVIGHGLDGRRIHWVQAYRARRRPADCWARGYELVRHSIESQERVFRMAEQLAARNITGNGFPVFDVLAAADRLASSAMALVLQQSCAQAKPVLWTDSVPSATGIPDHAAGALSMVPAYVGYLAINALTGRIHPWIIEGGHGAAAVDAVDRLRVAVADAHLPAGDFLDVEDTTSTEAPASRPPLVGFLSDGALERRKLAALTERWRRGGGKATAPVLMTDASWTGQLALSLRRRTDRYVARLRRDGFDPIVIDGRDPAAFAWGIFEIECRLAAAADACPCSCHPSETLVPCAVAAAPGAAAGPHESYRSVRPKEAPVAALSRRAIGGRVG